MHIHICTECGRDFPCDRLMTDSEFPTCDAPDACEQCAPPLPLEPEDEYEQVMGRAG